MCEVSTNAVVAAAASIQCGSAIRAPRTHHSTLASAVHGVAAPSCSVTANPCRACSVNEHTCRPGALRR